MDFRDSGQAGTGDVATVMDEVLEKMSEAVATSNEASEPLSSSTVLARRFPVVTDASRDALLTEFGKETLNDRYLLSIFDTPIQPLSFSGYPNQPRTYGITARYKF